MTAGPDARLKSVLAVRIHHPRVPMAAVCAVREVGRCTRAIGPTSPSSMAGCSLGPVFGIPIGILRGYLSCGRGLLDPYAEFSGFTPPIAFVTLAVIWLGPGE